MNLADYIAAYRNATGDLSQPYYCEDEEVVEWVNEAEEEAAFRARLLYDDTTPDVCEIAVTAGTSRYAMHETVFDIGRATLTDGDTRHALAIKTRDDMDAYNGDWQDWDTGDPLYLVGDESHVTLAPAPSSDCVLNIGVCRLPLSALSDPVDQPEIRRRHHHALLDWVLHRAYLKHNPEMQDLQKATFHEGRFEKYFGRRPDANVSRKQRYCATRTTRPIAF